MFALLAHVHECFIELILQKPSISGRKHCLKGPFSGPSVPNDDATLGTA
jgi:hypothetical protein